MKKIFILSLIISFTFLLCSCNNDISTEKYNELLSENESLKAEIETLSASNSELLNNVLEYSNREAEIINARALCSTCFNDSSICLVEGTSYMQCIAGKTYSITKDGIADILQDSLNSLYLLNEYKDDFQYDSISIKFLNDSGEYIADIIFKNIDNKYVLNSILCNSFYADIIVPYFNEATSSYYD